MLKYLAASALMLVCACGGGSDGGAGSGNGAISTVLVPDASAWDVAIDGDTLYWTSTSYPKGGIRKASRDGAGVTTLWEADLATMEPMVLDATNIYAVDALNGQIVAVPKAGGAATILVAPGTYSFLAATGLAVDDTNVYFTGRDTTTSSGVIGKVPKAGGMVTVLGTGPVSGLGVAVDAANVYFPTLSGAVSALSAVPKAGGPVKDLSSHQCLEMRIGGTQLYCMDAFSLYAHDLANPAAETAVLSPASGTSFTIVGDDVFVPEASGSGGESEALHILHGSLSAGGATTVYSDAGTHPLRVAADATTVFFTDLDDGAIRTVAR